jgi:glycerol-3-phosphate dehydrogenase
MASETIDRAIREKLLEKRKCRTKTLSLDDFNGELPKLHFRIYGRFSNEIAKLSEGKPELNQQVHSRLPYTVAEIIWICRNEMAVTVEDLLARRTRSLFLDSRSSVEAAPGIARILAAELGRDEKWEAEQVSSFQKLAENYILSETQH